MPIYVAAFVEKIKKMGNPFYIDMIPEYSSGGTQYPFRSLKIYVMSPFSDKKTNLEFVDFILELKKEIDIGFNFRGKEDKEGVYSHPLK